MIQIDVKKTGRLPSLGITGNISLYLDRELRAAGGIYKNRRLEPDTSPTEWRNRSHYEFPAPLMKNVDSVLDGKSIYTQEAERYTCQWFCFETILKELKAEKPETTERVLAQHTISEDFFARPPLPHQKAGLAFFLASLDVGGGHILLFDEMRTGKTKQAIDIANYLIKTERIGGILIICPNSIKRVWHKELCIDSPLYSMLTGIIQGTKKKKRAIWESKQFFYIVNYESARADKFAMYEWQERLRGKGWLLVCDEAHKLKNPQSLQSQAIRQLRPDYSIMMTGTPVANKPEDVWAMADFTSPGVLGATLWNFQEEFGLRGGYKGKEIIGYQKLDEVYRRLAKISMRRLRKDVVLDVTLRQTRYGQMKGKQLQAYTDMRDTLWAEMTTDDGEWTSVKAQNQLVKVLRLQQITDGYLSSSPTERSWFKENWKFKEIDDFINEYLDSIGKVVIWSRYVPVIEALSDRYKKYGAVHIRGKMGDQASENMYRFQDDKDCRIMVAQIQTSEGKGFQPATFCIFVDKWWSPHLNRQAEDRIVGIKNPVPITSISLVTEGTIDERLEHLLEKKELWSSEVMGEERETIQVPRLDKQALLYLLARPEEAEKYRV